MCSAVEITDIFWLEGICRGPVVLSTSCLYQGWRQGWIRLLRASPSWALHIPLNMALTRPFWEACPGAQPVSLKDFFLVPGLNFPCCVHSLLSFHGSLLRTVNLGVLCSCLLGSGAQQLNPPFSIPPLACTTPSPPASPPASWALLHALLGLLHGLCPVYQGLSCTGGPRPVTGLQMRVWVLRRGQSSPPCLLLYSKSVGQGFIVC